MEKGGEGAKMSAPSTSSLSVVTITGYRRKIWLLYLLYGISPHEVFQSWLINTVYHKRINRDWGLKRDRGLITFFPWKVRVYWRGWGVIWEREKEGHNKRFMIQSNPVKRTQRGLNNLLARKGGGGLLERVGGGGVWGGKERHNRDLWYSQIPLIRTQRGLNNFLPGKGEGVCYRGWGVIWEGEKEGNNRGFMIKSNPVNTDTKGP